MTEWERPVYHRVPGHGRWAISRICVIAEDWPLPSHEPRLPPQSNGDAFDSFWFPRPPEDEQILVRLLDRALAGEFRVTHTGRFQAPFAPVLAAGDEALAKDEHPLAEFVVVFSGGLPQAVVAPWRAEDDPDNPTVDAHGRE